MLDPEDTEENKAVSCWPTQKLTLWRERQTKLSKKIDLLHRKWWLRLRKIIHDGTQENRRWKLGEMHKQDLTETESNSNLTSVIQNGKQGNCYSTNTLLLINVTFKAWVPCN